MPKKPSSKTRAASKRRSANSVTKGSDILGDSSSEEVVGVPEIEAVAVAGEDSGSDGDSGEIGKGEADIKLPEEVLGLEVIDAGFSEARAEAAAATLRQNSEVLIEEAESGTPGWHKPPDPTEESVVVVKGTVTPVAVADFRPEPGVVSKEMGKVSRYLHRGHRERPLFKMIAHLQGLQTLMVQHMREDERQLRKGFRATNHDVSDMTMQQLLMKSWNAGMDVSPYISRKALEGKYRDHMKSVAPLETQGPNAEYVP